MAVGNHASLPGDEGRSPGGPLPSPSQNYTSRLICAKCDSPCASKQDSKLHHLCDLHRREHQRSVHDNQRGSGRRVNPYNRQAGETKQLHEEPLPYESIPFDSGQFVALRAFEIGDIDDVFIVIETLLVSVLADNGEVYCAKFYEG